MLFLKLAFWEGKLTNFKVNKIFGLYLRLLGCMGIPVDSVGISIFWNLKRLTHLEWCSPARAPNTWPELQYHCPAKTREIYFSEW